MSAQTSSQGDPQRELDKLTSLLKNVAVGKVKVLHVEDSANTRVGVNKKALHAIASSSLVFSDHIPEKFSSLLSDVSVKEESDPPDLRWGLFFYDAQGQQIGSLFCDKFGQDGFINDQTVSFDTGTLGRNLAQRLHKLTGIRD